MCDKDYKMRGSKLFWTKKDIKNRLIKRPNYNKKLLKLFKSIQLSLSTKKKKSNYVIKNDFSSKKAKNSVKKILSKLNK